MSKNKTTTIADIEIALDEASGYLNNLKIILQEETDLIKHAKLYDAANLESAKTRAAAAYVESLESIKRLGPVVKQHASQSLEKLTRLNDELQQVIQHNLTVLATAKAVSEGLIMEVAEEVTRKNSSPQGYGAYGQEARTRNTAPIAISRKM